MMHQGVEISLVFPAENSFQDVYYRTSSRINGHRNMRCFPSCSPSHNENTFCGRSLRFVVNLMVQKNSVADFNKFDLDCICCVGEFRSQDRESAVPSFMLGSKLGDMVKTRKNANKNLYWGRQICTYKQEEIKSSSGTFILYKAMYEINSELRGWQYPTAPNVRFRGNQQHVFTIALLSPGGRISGKKLSGINCGSVLQTVFKDDVFYPIAYFDSPPFSVGFCKTKLTAGKLQDGDKVIDYDLEPNSDQENMEEENSTEKQVIVSGETDNPVSPDEVLASEVVNAIEYLEQIKKSSNITIMDEGQRDLQIPIALINNTQVQSRKDSIVQVSSDLCSPITGESSTEKVTEEQEDDHQKSSTMETDSNQRQNQNHKFADSNCEIVADKTTEAQSKPSPWSPIAPKESVLGYPLTMFQDFGYSFSSSSRTSVIESLLDELRIAEDDYPSEEEIPANLRRIVEYTQLGHLPQSSAIEIISKSYCTFGIRSPFDVPSFLLREVLEKRRANLNHDVVISTMFQRGDYINHLEQSQQQRLPFPLSLPVQSSAPHRTSSGHNGSNGHDQVGSSSSGGVRNEPPNLSRSASKMSEANYRFKQLPDDVDYFQRLDLLSLTTCFTDPSLAEIMPPPYSKGEHFLRLFKKLTTRKNKSRKLMHFVQQFFSLTVTFPIALEPALYYLKMLHVANGKLVTLSHVNPIASILRETSTFAPYFGLSRLQSLNTQACEELFEPLFLDGNFEEEGYVSMTHKQLDFLMKNAVNSLSRMASEEVQSLSSSSKSSASHLTIETLIEWLDSEQGGGSKSSSSHNDKDISVDSMTMQTDKSIQDIIDDDSGAILLINMISEYYSKDVLKLSPIVEQKCDDGEEAANETESKVSFDPISNPVSCLLSLHARIRREQEEDAERNRIAVQDKTSENKEPNSSIPQMEVPDQSTEQTNAVENTTSMMNVANEVSALHVSAEFGSSSHEMVESDQATPSKGHFKGEASDNISVHNENKISDDEEKDNPPWKRIKVESPPQLL